MAKKRKPYIQTVLFGILSLASYLVLFNYESLVTETYTRGGIYTAMPVATALYFSFTHGAFASSLLSVLGIEAAKSKPKKH